MTDRELLEKAAKAAGIVGGEYCETSGGEPALYVHGASLGVPNAGIWSPLTDDGDALRLAVKLEMDLILPWGGDSSDPRGPSASVIFPIDGDFDSISVWMTEEPDPNAAARRAIVRAAAAIGEKQQ